MQRSITRRGSTNPPTRPGNGLALVHGLRLHADPQQQPVSLDAGELHYLATAGAAIDNSPGVHRPACWSTATALPW
ncbi:hypothetical protein GC101_27005 [Paenibacillus sp. LMG 31459]|uniref:Uncharacterized protein n=1 Tax=Paenibacillus phytohabitans TaxID=2654978 RepID=A0ABX1YSF2_9BACL|nr:hypothetical protein [Paenibacillus phytohabitans]NOU82519.1 hypothetical protein [Paenibacillus phytohabitans]